VYTTVRATTNFVYSLYRQRGNVYTPRVGIVKSPQVAELLNLTYWTLQNLLRGGRIQKPQRDSSGHYAWSEADIAAAKAASPRGARASGRWWPVSEREADDGLTVREFARRYRVSKSKVLAWIKRGELLGVNMTDRRSQRPRFVIPAAAITEFERARAGHQSAKPAPQRRRAPVGKDFFPD
jgi:hypothetical protein